MTKCSCHLPPYGFRACQANHSPDWIVRRKASLKASLVVLAAKLQYTQPSPEDTQPLDPWFLAAAQKRHLPDPR